MTAIYKSEAGQRRVEERYRSFLSRWPVPAEFVSVPTREGETFVIVCGPKDAPPLVLLHGSTSNSSSWLGDISAYAAHFRCYAVDLIGEPGLSAPSRPSMESDAYGLWLDDVLDSLELDRVSLIGLSLGGWMAFHYAANRSERIIALAGITPAGICHTRNFVLKYLPYFFLGEWGRRKIREAVMGPLPADLPPEAQEYMEFFGLIASEFKPRTSSLPVLSDEQVRGLHFPVFVITGGRDVMLFGEETRDRLQALAPNAIVDYRPEARHFIPGTVEAVLPFLQEVHGLTPSSPATLKQAAS